MVAPGSCGKAEGVKHNIFQIGHTNYVQLVGHGFLNNTKLNSQIVPGGP